MIIASARAVNVLCGASAPCHCPQAQNGICVHRTPTGDYSGSEPGTGSLNASVEWCHCFLLIHLPKSHRFWKCKRMKFARKKQCPILSEKGGSIMIERVWWLLRGDNEDSESHSKTPDSSTEHVSFHVGCSQDWTALAKKFHIKQKYKSTFAIF